MNSTLLEKIKIKVIEYITSEEEDIMDGRNKELVFDVVDEEDLTKYRVAEIRYDVFPKTKESYEVEYSFVLSGGDKLSRLIMIIEVIMINNPYDTIDGKVEVKVGKVYLNGKRLQ